MASSLITVTTLLPGCYLCSPAAIEKDNYIFYTLIDFILKNEKLDSMWLYYEISDTGIDLYDYMQVTEAVK